MLCATVLLPEGKSERKLLQLCYPLLTSASKAPTRGHCSGGEEKKTFPLSVQWRKPSPPLLKQKHILLGCHYSYFYTFSASLPIYASMKTCVHLLDAFVWPRTHPPLPRAFTSVDQLSHSFASAPSSQLPPNEPVFVWTFSVAFELISSIS